MSLARSQFNGKAVVLGVIAALAVLSAGIARAHDFWIEPGNFHPNAGERVPLRLFVGEHLKGESVLYAPEQFERYVVVGPGGEEPVRGTLGDDPAGTVTLAKPGLYMIGYHSKPFELSFDNFDKFAGYLKTEGLERHLTIAQKRFKIREGIVEIYTRHAKSLIQVGDGSGGFDHTFGFPLELVAQTNPFGNTNKLTVQLLYRGKPLEGALIIASNENDPMNKQRIRSDKNGRATFAINKPGMWLVNAVHIIPTGLLAKADWESFWASLTFARQ